MTLRLPLSWTRTRFSRYCAVLGLGRLGGRSTHLLELGLCLRHRCGGICASVRWSLGCEKVVVELVRELQVSNSAPPERAFSRCLAATLVVS